ncbi:hypothetical protein GCM10009764_81910 [Nocardia ninae]
MHVFGGRVAWRTTSHYRHRAHGPGQHQRRGQSRRTPTDDHYVIFFAHASASLTLGSGTSECSAVSIVRSLI